MDRWDRALWRRVVLVLLAGMFGVAAAGADERIIDYRSDIQVHVDGSLTVAESIRVRAEGRQIRRGIYRDFPTTYRDNQGNRYVVDFDVQSVTRDGRPEPYHTEDLSNGVRVYAGDSQVFLDHGEYTYEFRYTTNRQLGFFPEHDELYWNVTGTGWAFPIDRVAARVKLPAGIDTGDVGLNGYTGPQGSTDRYFRAGYDNHGDVHFETTRGLGQHNGLTIVVTWPKGHVDEPTRTERVGYLLKDNAHLLVSLVGLLAALAYYLLTWRRVGVDPRKGVVVPLFEPPRNLSPAATRFIMEMGYDPKAFTAAIINLAVKGALEIHDDDGDYTLEKLDFSDVKTLSSGEALLYGKLFSEGHDLVLEQANHKRVSGATKAFRTYLQREFEADHFRTNGTYMVPGVAISLVALVAGILLSPALGMETIMLTVWLSVWTFAVIFLVKSRRWFMAAIFGAFEIPALLAFHEMSSLYFVIMLVAVASLNVLFYYLLQAPTRLGRKIMDEIEGFRRYLEVAEEDRLNLLNPPEKTPELFERYLPYALALGVDQQWSEKFSAILAAAARDPQSEYRPRWYHGSGHGNFSAGSFSRGVGAGLAAAVASAAVAPGSSSGSGGGGFSGGGGGGGGGGGW